jgi:hypothetical protein
MRFLGHLILFYCAFIASILASMFVGALIPSLGQDSNPWATVLGEPAWILEEVVCLLAGYFFYTKMRRKSAFVVWLVPSRFWFGARGLGT